MRGNRSLSIEIDGGKYSFIKADENYNSIFLK